VTKKYKDVDIEAVACVHNLQYNFSTTAYNSLVDNIIILKLVCRRSLIAMTYELLSIVCVYFNFYF